MGHLLKYNGPIDEISAMIRVVIKYDSDKLIKLILINMDM